MDADASAIRDGVGQPNSDTGASAHIQASLESGAVVRELVFDLLTTWDCASLVDDALLAATELASNATLHTRAPFDMNVRRIRDGVRIEVVDTRPDQLPVAVPQNGTATDLTANAMTGRGLLIIGMLASRWGYTTSPTAKSVWVELEDGADPDWTEPIAALGHDAQPSSSEVALRFLSLPVRTAVASGIQVEELVREVQLGQDAVIADAAELDHLYAVLDSSATPRLAGRHAALRAAARGLERFDLEFSASLASLAAVGDSARMLADIASRLSGGPAALSADVVEFRRWLGRETSRQLEGTSPAPCPLPS